MVLEGISVASQYAKLCIREGAFDHNKNNWLKLFKTVKWLWLYFADNFQK